MSQTQLHLLCHIPGVSLQKLAGVIQRRPRSLQTQDGDGRLPLHIAAKASKYHSLEVFKCLVDAYPKGLQVRDKQNRLPLHVMLEYGGQPEAIALVVARYPRALRIRSGNGGLPIHLLLQTPGADAKLVRLLLLQYPDSLRVCTKSRGWIPLHVACYRKQSVSVLRALIEGYPLALQTADRDGSLPLHLAAAKHADVDAIRYLIRKCPDSIHQKDRMGNLAIHAAVKRALFQNKGRDLVVLEYLIRKYPHGLQIPNARGKLPLELALEPARVTVHVHGKRKMAHVFPQSVNLIRVLVKGHPRALGQTLSASGMLPLHHVISLCGLCPPQEEEHHFDNKKKQKELLLPCEYCEKQKETIRFIMNEYPPSLQLVNEQGETALHHACRYHGDRLDIVKMILTKCPEAAVVQDRQGNLPLFLLAESGFSSLDVVLLMVEYSLHELIGSDAAPQV